MINFSDALTDNNRNALPVSVTCAHPPVSVSDADDAFSNAIKKNWHYQWYIDDLPVWGMVDELLF
jgi:hypothetical protein